jgi:Ca2+-transporting ATPase
MAVQAQLPRGHAQPSFHAQDVALVAERLGTDLRRGLSVAQARARLSEVGANVIRGRQRSAAWRLFLEQFTSMLVVVLLAAAVVSGVFLGAAVDAAVIVAIVILNAALGFVQRYRAENALAALQELSAPTAVVVRQGAETRVAAAELVPGDLIRLRKGDRVPADARLIDSHRLAASESLLTGESFPSAKDAHEVPSTASVADRTSMVFMGTTIAAGRGSGVVTGTGAASELGAVAEVLSEPAAPTPLQGELDRVGKVIAAIALAVVALISFTGWLQGLQLHTMFLTAVALAVAAIPEGLPAVVTITLARGVRRLAHHGTLVRRLQAVETLGAAGVLCTDKTGTLTHDRIVAERMAFADKTGFDTTVERGDRRAVRFAEAAALCNDAEVRGDAPGVAIGDPVDVAVLGAVRELGDDPAAVRAAWERVGEAPFDPRRKLMSTLHRARSGEAPLLLSVKGAPETVIALASHVALRDADRPLTEKIREELLVSVTAMAGSGMRPLAFACRELDGAPADLEAAESELTLLGVMGLRDELRVAAGHAVAEAHSAGIRVVMISGDHSGTARAVAQSLGILEPGQEVVSGADIARLTPAELRDRLPDIGAFARVDPADKVRVVQGWQERGEVVAVTGDGVNDAPALHVADIGVAMGSGTDVSRDAADVVLADDDFSTLVAAVREGRGIFDNLVHVIRFLLTTNMSEIVLMAVGVIAFASLGPVLLPTQILWVNLVTDGIPVLALANDPPAEGVMRRSPSRNRHLLTRAQIRAVLVGGSLLALAPIGSLVYGEYISHASRSEVQTMVFTAIVLATLMYSFSVRRDGREHPLSGARWVVGATLVSLLLQVGVIYVPFGNRLFHTAPLGLMQWIVVTLLGAAALALVELTHWWRAR